MQEVLSKIENWQFDSFELHEATGGWPLSTLTFAIMRKYKLIPTRYDAVGRRAANKQLHICKDNFQLLNILKINNFTRPLASDNRCHDGDSEHMRLARFLCRVEEGYPDNKYHCR